MTRPRAAEAPNGTIAIVGAGFGGTILARALRAAGRDVLLIERGRHPRFALGESTTPLANLALERLAGKYHLEDLRDLASHGRWRRRLPQLRCGLKRGFTFYGHRPGAEYQGGASSARRLLVAASPDDEVADTQWLREDVDAFLVERAEAEGVRYLDRAAVTALERGDGLWRLRVRRAVGGGTEEETTLEASFVVDASGPGGFLTQALGLRSRTTPPGYASRLVFGHFDDLPPFSRVVPGLPEPHDPGEPFPEQWAAVHHLLDLGWMYQLRFDSGRTSAGFLLDPERLEARGFELPSAPERAFALLLSRYPSLERQFSSSRVVSLGATGVLQRRVEPAAGAGWALLPSAYAFHDPLFSTGIAWTLLGVERLAELLSTASGEVSPSGLARYRDLLALEADHLDRLLAGAYRLIDDFPRFAFFALLYFAAASYNELRQRLLDPSATEAWCWGGFLGADDARLAEAVALAPQQAATMAPQAFARWVLAAIAPRDLVGLDDPSGPGLYSARLEPVVARAELLGLTPEAVRLRLPRLRGAAVVTEGRI